MGAATHLAQEPSPVRALRASAVVWMSKSRVVTRLHSAMVMNGVMSRTLSAAEG